MQHELCLPCWLSGTYIHVTGDATKLENEWRMANGECEARMNKNSPDCVVNTKWKNKFFKLILTISTHELSNTYSHTCEMPALRSEWRTTRKTSNGKSNGDSNINSGSDSSSCDQSKAYSGKR